MIGLYNTTYKNIKQLCSKIANSNNKDCLDNTEIEVKDPTINSTITIRIFKYYIPDEENGSLYFFVINTVGNAMNTKTEWVISSSDLFDDIIQRKESMHPIAMMMKGKYVIIEMPQMSNPIVYFYYPRNNSEDKVYKLENPMRKSSKELLTVLPLQEKLSRDKKLKTTEDENTFFNYIADQIETVMLFQSLGKLLEQIKTGSRVIDNKTMYALKNFYKQIEVKPEDIAFINFNLMTK